MVTDWTFCILYCIPVYSHYILDIVYWRSTFLSLSTLFEVWCICDIYLITENILWITLKSWINCRTKITIWPVFSDFRQASFSPVFPKPRRNPPMDVPHRLVPGSRKRCALCYYYRVKTKSGWDIYTNYKCEACDVALCNREITQCFGRFHEGIKLHYNAQMIVNSVLGCEQDKRWNLSVGQFLWENLSGE